MVNEKEPPQLISNLLFPKIFQTFRMAIQPSKLIIAFSAVAVICLAGWIMDFFVVIRGESGVFATLWCSSAAKFQGAINSLFAFNLPAVAANIADWFGTVGWAIRHHYLYSIVFFAITLAAISIAGGAICRIAALQFARGEKPGLTEALRFSIKKFLSFFTTPLAPVGIIIFIGLFIFLLGLIGNIPRVGELIMGILMVLALIAGTLIAVVLIGTVAGFNLMFPAVAYDGSDCFDAISRSFSYVYSKPWQMGFYTATAAVYGAICYTFVRCFAFLLLLATRWFLQLGVWVENSSKQVNKLTAIWPKPTFMNLSGPADLATANWSESAATFLVYLLLLVIIGLLVSFVISFYFSANTIIYALMRKRVDDTALEDIFSPVEQAKTEPTTTESKPEESQPQPESETQDD